MFDALSPDEWCAVTLSLRATGTRDENAAATPITASSRAGAFEAAIRAPIATQLQSGAWIRQGDELNQLDAGQIEINSQWVWTPAYSLLIYGAPL